MKKLLYLFVTTLFFVACYSNMDESGSDLTYDDLSSSSLAAGSSSFFATLPYKANPNLEHELTEVNDALGSCLNIANPLQELAYVVVYSLIPPIKSDSILKFLPDTLGHVKQTLINDTAYSLKSVIPNSPLNGSTYTILDSIGYYHNLVISKILSNDPYGEKLKLLSSSQIINDVTKVIERELHLPTNTFFDSSFQSTLNTRVQTLMNIRDTCSSDSSYISTIKVAFPTTSKYADYIWNMSYIQTSLHVLGLAYQNVDSSSSMTDQEKQRMKKALIVEFASDRLWK